MLGALARSIATLILFPYIRAKVLVQAKKKKSDLEKGNKEEEEEVDDEPEGIVGTLQKVYNEEGVLALYRGLAPELTKVRFISLLFINLVC